MIQYSNGTFPCPIFNVRINFTATEVLFDRPRISTSISWDYPHGMFDLVVQWELSKIALSEMHARYNEQQEVFTPYPSSFT